jgi:hypothetical protein
VAGNVSLLVVFESLVSSFDAGMGILIEKARERGTLDI